MLALQIISILIALLVGVAVVTRDPGDRNRWLLLFFNTSIAFWMLSGIFADIPGDLGLVWNRIVFVAVVTTIFAAYLLIASLANRLGAMAWFFGVGYTLLSMVILF